MRRDLLMAARGLFLLAAWRFPGGETITAIIMIIFAVLAALTAFAVLTALALHRTKT
jgi:hypothetical protein